MNVTSGLIVVINHQELAVEILTEAMNVRVMKDILEMEYTALVCHIL